MTYSCVCRAIILADRDTLTRREGGTEADVDVKGFVATPRRANGANVVMGGWCLSYAWTRRSFVVVVGRDGWDGGCHAVKVGGGVVWRVGVTL